MCNTTARAGKTGSGQLAAASARHPRNRPGEIPARPAAALHQSPATRRTAARRAAPEP